MLDYNAILLDPIYTVLGVPATLALVAGGEPVTVTAIDKTSGVDVSTDPNLQTILPAACVRVSELAAAGVTREALADAVLTMNGATWRVTSTRPKPTPRGESVGEIYLLVEEHEVPSEPESEPISEPESEPISEPESEPISEPESEDDGG